MLVNHKFLNFLDFLEVYFIGQFLSAIIHPLCYYLPVYYLYVLLFYNKTLRWMALRRSHFQCGNMQGEGHLRVP